MFSSHVLWCSDIFMDHINMILKKFNGSCSRGETKKTLRNVQLQHRHHKEGWSWGNQGNQQGAARGTDEEIVGRWWGNLYQGALYKSHRHQPRPRLNLVPRSTKCYISRQRITQKYGDTSWTLFSGFGAKYFWLRPRPLVEWDCRQFRFGWSTVGAVLWSTVGAVLVCSARTVREH